MSVITAADESRKVALKGIDTAIHSIANIVIDKQWGYDDFSTTEKVRLRNALQQLMEIEDSLI